MMKTPITESFAIDLEKIKAVISEKYNVKFEAFPKKSDSDKKEYLVIKLNNGLTALLISDVENLIDPSDIVYNSKVTDISDESNDFHNLNCKVSDSENENKKHADKTEQLAACALSVGVGCFSDPETIPGLAHLLKHMLFLGSKKYPKENDFDSFISSRDGCHNTYTECEYTTYSFNCPDKYLFISFERFVSFFVSPLMKRDSITKEREAIESLFKLRGNLDTEPTEQVFCSTASLNNPAHKLMWDNLKSVTDDVLYNTLKEFWNNQYSANRMTVAVQARLPLDIIGIWVAKFFGEIPSHNLPKKVFPVINVPFRMELFNKIYILRPVEKSNCLRLTWAFPSVIHFYKAKPLSYISYLFGYEGGGSLLSYLQHKLWTKKIVAGTSESGISYNSMYSLFSINIYVTEEGLQNAEQIVALIFSYIELLRHEGPSESIFKEIQIIHDLHFHYEDASQFLQKNAYGYVQELSKNMQFYPPIDYITSEKLITEYKPDEISKILNLMTPKSVNIMILSKSAAKKASLESVEPWSTNVLFKLHDIPDDLYHKWENCGLDPNFCLPKPNIYIPCNFSMIPFPSDHIVYPRNILKNNYMEIWYKRDLKLKLPYGYIKIYLISTIASISPQNSVMCDILVALLNLLIFKETYPASLAKLKFSLSAGDNGLIFSINGFSDKMTLLLIKVLTEMVSFTRQKHIPDGLFEAIKSQQRKAYYHQILDASKLANEIQFSILCTQFWGCVSKLEVIHDITIEKFIEFNANFFENLYLKWLIQGNISENILKDISTQVKEIINYKPLTPGTYPKIRICMLPPNEKIIRVQSFSTHEINYAFTNYYQCDLTNIENSCIIEIVLLMMKEQFLDKLRTQEKFAYEVIFRKTNMQSVLGFIVNYESQSDKFSIEYVENYITLFLNEFFKDLKNTKSKDFNQFKESLIIQKLQFDSYWKDEVEKNWVEIVSDEYMFDRNDREVKSIETIQISNLIQYFKTIYVSFGSARDCKHDFTETFLRKLSVQVDAEGHPITKSDSSITSSQFFEEEINIPADFKAKLQIKVPNDTKLTCKFIVDIEQFKSKLFIFPSKFHVS